MITQKRARFWGCALLGACVLVTSPVWLYVLLSGPLPPFPTTDIIARRYVAAIVARDPQAAAALSNPERCPFGPPLDDIQRDSARFGGAEIRGLAVDTVTSMGSDDRIELARVRFTYRAPGTSAWQPGEMLLETTYKSLGPRCLVGNNEYHGP